MDSTQFSDHYSIEEPIDTITPPGHYARVFRAKVTNPMSKAGDAACVAFKVMRDGHVGAPGHADGEWEAFSSEVRILRQLIEHPMVITLLDCGYIRSVNEWVENDEPIVSMGLDVDEFVNQMNELREDGWRPYLVVEYLTDDWSVFMDIEVQNPWSHKRYSVDLVLRITAQFIDLLVQLQENDYVYLDHKLEHVYWIPDSGRIKIIDWNGGWFLNELSRASSPEEKRRVDGVELIIAVMYAMLTGKPLYETVGKAPVEGRARATGIMQLDQMPEFPVGSKLYLPGSTVLKDFFNEVLQGKFDDARELQRRYDRVLLAYGLPDSSGNDPDDNTKQARAKVLAAHHEFTQTVTAIEQFRDAVEGLLISADDPLPHHFQEDIETLWANLGQMLNTNIVVPK